MNINHIRFYDATAREGGIGISRSCKVFFSLNDQLHQEQVRKVMEKSIALTGGLKPEA